MLEQNGKEDVFAGEREATKVARKNFQRGNGSGLGVEKGLRLHNASLSIMVISRGAMLSHILLNCKGREYSLSSYSFCRLSLCLIRMVGPLEWSVGSVKET